MKQKILLLTFIAFGVIFSVQAQEGSLLGKFKSGFYFDKQGQKKEGLIKYSIRSSAGVEKVKSFKFKTSEDSEAVKIDSKTANGFGLNKSDRVYHTIYKNTKAKNKNKGGNFARVYIGSKSLNERATIYYSLENAPVDVIQNGVQYLSNFIVRSVDDTKETSVRLVLSPHKKVFTKLYGDCPAFQKGLEADNKFLKVSNLENVIKLINKECK